MSDVYPWIGFQSKKDRERFKQRIFWEYKKTKPSVVSGRDGTTDRRLTDKEIRHILDIHNATYEERETFYILSDMIKMPEGLHWVIFCGWWGILKKLEEILQKEYKNYVYLVAH